MRRRASVVLNARTFAPGLRAPVMMNNLIPAA